MNVAAGAAGLLLAAFYLAQFMTIAPWDPDGGLILGYVHQVAHGERPYFDFVDAYGPLNWPLPALFYRAFGDEVIGIRVLLLLLKLSSVLLAFQIVRRLADRSYAWLAAAGVTLLLGLPWPYLQSAYSFHQALPLMLLCWLFLLVRPLPHAAWNVAAAGAATALVIWLKLNTGLFLLAAGLLHCFCWMPTGPQPDAPRLTRWRGPFRAAQWLGVAAYGVVFAAFMAEHFDRYYLLYLAAPLGIALAATALRVAEARRDGEPVAGPLLAWATFLGTVVALSLVFVLPYFGSAALEYVRELTALLSSLRYAHPLPALGEPGVRIGFNESYWLQLPWLLTAVFAVWWMVAGQRPGERRDALHGLFVFVALGGFVLYSRADENHVFQAVVPAVPALFVYLQHLEGVFGGEVRARRLGFRAAVAAAAVAYGSTIFFLPGALRWTEGAWSPASMRFIEARPHPHQRHPTPAALLRRVDGAVDEAARYLDEITEDGSPVLVLSRHELLNFLSHTRPAGGRYKYLLYLAKTDLIDRQALEALAPAGLIDALVSDPPEVIVAVHEESYLLNVLPELGEVLEARYRMAQRFGGIRVFVKAP